jgi:hypothetical protein
MIGHTIPLNQKRGEAFAAALAAFPKDNPKLQARLEK